MPTPTALSPSRPRYLSLFPDWEGRRPLGWFFAEPLLEARAEAGFATNCRGTDEDVNMYILGLLVDWVTSDPAVGVAPAVDPLFMPPSRRLGHRARAAIHRRQADHRLLALGLFDRGDLVRRRRTGWRMTGAETRARDLTVMQRGYAAAADLTAGCPDLRGPREVWRKLATHGEDYVHVLQTLARRRLGLGARLGEADLAHLLGSA
ncbi:MAG: hypothetical protein R3D98_03775 [Candidatus Krumholzibacteriia bacterium]